MSHDKFYGICENKCRVQLPIIQSTEVFQEDEIASNSSIYITVPASGNFDLPQETHNYTVVGSLTAIRNTVSTNVSIDCMLKDDNIIVRITNHNESVIIPAASFLVCLTLIQHV